MKLKLTSFFYRNVKNNYLFLISFCIPILMNAQQDYEISIPSPNAAAFTNQIDVPVNQFNGKVNYSIPIYQIQENGVNLPINLSYTASGFKPNEHPGWVGTGFSLNAGGVITRKTRGRNDDLLELRENRIGTYDHLSLGFFYTYFKYYNDVQNRFDNLINKNFPQLSVFKNFQPHGFGPVVTNEIENDIYVTADIEPDDFYFSFGQYSGKFFFDTDMKPRVVSNDKNLKIEIRGLCKDQYNDGNGSVDSYSFSGFKIINNEGFVYEFGCEGGTVIKNIERSQDAMSPITKVTNDAWYLSKILSPNGEELANFEYLQNEWGTHIQSTTSRRDLLVNNNQYHHDIKPIKQLILSRDLTYNNQPEPSIQLSLNGKMIHPCYLSKISTNKEVVTFHTSISKELQHHPKDIQYHLDNMYGEYLGSQKLAGQLEKDHKKILLRLTGYDGSIYATPNPNINWIKLDSVTIEDKTKKKIKTSRFYYTQNKFERLRLLKYQENDIPPYIFEYSNLNNRYIDNISELDENHHPNIIPYGTIAVDNLGYAGNSSRELIPPGLLLAGEKKIDWDKNNPNIPEWLPGYYYNFAPYSASNYLENNLKNDYMWNLEAELGRDLTLSDLLGEEDGVFNLSYIERIEDDLKTNKLGYYNNENTINNSINKIQTPMGGLIEFEYEPHTTKKSIIRNNNGEVAVKDRVGFMSGIRIKSIKTYDSSDKDKYVKKEFSYDMGVLFYESLHYQDYALQIERPDNLYAGPNYDGGFCNLFCLTGSRTGNTREISFINAIRSFSLNTYLPGATNDLGSYIGYSKVTEISTNSIGENIGKNVKYYRNYKDHPDLYSQSELLNKQDEHLESFDNDIKLPTPSLAIPNKIPLSTFPVTSLNRKIGKLVQNDIYNNENKKIKETKLEYLNESNNFRILNHLKVIPLYFDFGAHFKYVIDIYISNTYEYHYSPVVLSKKSVTDYFDDDSFTNNITYNYFYNTEENSVQLTSNKSFNSKGEQTETLYTYSSDYTTSIHDIMKEKNIISPIITTTVKKNDQTIGGSLNTYRTGDTSKGESTDQILKDKSYQLLPKKTLPSTLYSPDQNIDETIWDENVEYVRFDTDNNLLQYRKDDDIDVCYIYGYNNTLPIAKLENITYDEIPSTDIANIKALTDLDKNKTTENELRDALNSLRISLPNSMVSTYTYDPLVGVTSMTDPKGQVTYYEYDHFGRLDQVKDQDGKIIKKHNYNYKK